MIILQGILLGVTGLGGFGAGVYATRARWSRSAAARQPCLVLGTIVYRESTDAESERRPDAGSVALLFPRDVRPDRGQKLKVSGLRPQDPPLTLGDPAYEALRTLGADYARASEQGFYYLKARDIGSYFLLVLSAHRQRESSAAIDRKHLAEIGRYVDRAAELLGGTKYEWREITLQGDEQIDVTF